MLAVILVADMNVPRTFKFLSKKPYNVNNATKSHADRLSCFSFLPGFSMNCFIGTAVALAGLREGLRWAEIDVSICRKK